ncbi:MAG: hypothetical protein ACK5LX_00495 [Oscillospiraceae bacterium]
MAQRKQWSKLDNAAKIFPPTASRRDTKVFRLVCELTEPVESAPLQLALERTMELFPLFRSILKKGLFWYFFEESSLRRVVAEEDIPICSEIYHPDKPGLLFRVSYYNCRINLEIFHALADGAGAMQFLRTMVFFYLAERHGISGQLSDYDAAPDQKGLDAFYKYYDKTKRPPAAKSHRAYRIRGERFPDDRLSVTEGTMSAKAVLDKAHEYKASLSELLIALLISSVSDGMAVRELGRPVVITVPVDLRRFFPAETARNFFGVITVTHNFKKDGQEFPQILANVQSAFTQQLTPENLSGIISRYSMIENNLLVKIIPLQLKIPFLRIAGLWADGEDTAAFSNVGRVTMPEEASKHIRLFDLFLSTKRPQLCLCSFGDTLAISVSSPLTDTSLQRRFFRKLTAMGIDIQVVSNLEQLAGEEDNGERGSGNATV